LRLGIHLYTFGSLEKAARRAAEIGADTLQIFTASPRMWRANPIDPAKAAAFRAILKKHGIRPLVVHVNYLVNLASRDEVIRAKSIATLRGELDRAAAVGAKYLVVHPGNCMGLCMDDAVGAAAEGIVEAAAGIGKSGVTLLLENTAGSGTCVGCRLEELRAIRDLAAPQTDLPIGYCLDTCHLFAAGFDIATPSGLRETIRHTDKVLGLKYVHVIHANDSKTRFGSRVDRHAKIGEGHIGRMAFRRMLAHPKLQRKVFISETPVEADGDDLRNLETLKALAGRAAHSTS
jgi:deoxyribonuclease IV